MKRAIVNPIVQKAEDVGPLWNGEMDTLNRLMLGIPSNLGQAAVSEGILTQTEVDVALPKLIPHVVEPIILAGADPRCD